MKHPALNLNFVRACADDHPALRWRIYVGGELYVSEPFYGVRAPFALICTAKHTLPCTDELIYYALSDRGNEEIFWKRRDYEG